MIDPMTLLIVAPANILGAAMAAPQARALFRTRNTGGVSPAWAAMSAAINLWWAIYGVATADLMIVPVSLISVIAYLAIAVALLKFRPTGRAHTVQRLSLGATVGLVPVPLVLMFGWAVAGIALGALYAVQLSPAVVTVYRTVDVTGVAATTWLMAWCEAALWGAYAGPAGDVGLVALALTGVTMSTLVLARLYVKRPRRRAARGYAFVR